MGNFNRDDRAAGGYRGGFARGGGRGFSRGRSSFGGGDRGDRPMFKAICSNCGKECEVPFRPTNGKPVYCSDCFEKLGRGNDRQSSDRPRFDDRNRAPQAQGGPDLSAINAKLDKILGILEPKVSVPVFTAPVVKTPAVEKVVEEVKETKAPKAKKVVKKSASIKK